MHFSLRVRLCLFIHYLRTILFLQPNRKSYSRPKRQIVARTMETISSNDENTAEDDDDDDNMEVRHLGLPKSRSSKRKKSEAAIHAREFDLFAEEFNSMCEEVEQFEVVVERSA